MKTITNVSSVENGAGSVFESNPAVTIVREAPVFIPYCYCLCRCSCGGACPGGRFGARNCPRRGGSVRGGGSCRERPCGCAFICGRCGSCSCRFCPCCGCVYCIFGG